MALTFKRINTVASNTAPPLTFTATRSGTAISLVSASNVKLYIVTALTGGTQTNTGHETVTITNAAAGECSYTRQAGDIPSAGTYYGDLLVNYNDGSDEVLNDILLIVARGRLAGE